MAIKKMRERIGVYAILLSILIFTLTTNLEARPSSMFGELPSTGTIAPDFTLTNTALRDVSLSDFEGYNLILNIFPSIDTAVCAASVREFNERANELNGTKVLAVSHDLPFAMNRYCAAEGLDNIVPMSAFRSPEFGQEYGLLITSGPFRGLLARAVIIINGEGEIIYTEHVLDINQEPEYDDALNALPE